MYLKRKIDKYLEAWKSDKNRNPLVIKGARQIGKTASILHFARNNYSNVIYINFYEETIYKNILNNGLKVDEIIKNITKIDPYKNFTQNDTIIVFDEVQDFIELTASLKFFKLDGRFDVICSGSLLGINYHRVDSISVGYKTDYEMSGFDFEEFLWAKGYDDSLIQSLLKHMIDLTPFSDFEYKLYKDLFIDFTTLGGMPRVISQYIDNKTFEGTLQTQIQISGDYKEDIKKYAEGLEKNKILSVYSHIPIQLSKENKKFQLSKIHKNARNRDFFGVIEWLKDAGLINICYCLKTLSLPLKANYNENQYKIYTSDTGLLLSQLDEESQIDLRVNQNLGIYKGAIFENMVAEAFKKSNLELFYFKNNSSTLEIDFVTRTQKGIVVIEVKSNNGNSKSLNTILANDEYPEIIAGIKLADKNIGFNKKYYTFPYFLTFLLKRFLTNLK